MNIVLVADFGSSNVRVHAIDTANGKIIAQHAMKYPMLSPQPGFFEHDAREMWLHSATCMEKVMQDLDGKAEIRALSFSHIGASLVPMDADFNATYNCILGMDCRADEEARQLEDRLSKQGKMPDTSFTCASLSAMAKTLYIKQKMPEVAAKTKYYVSIQQYILAQLGLPIVWDETEAGSHSCYDVLTRQWSLPVLDAVGIDIGTLGNVVHSHESVGTIRRYGDVQFSKPVPVVIGGHDAVMGTIGLGVYNEAEDTIAEVTGSVDVYCFLMNRVFGFTEEQQANVREGSLLMSEPGPLKGTTMILAGYKTAGAVIEWIIREMYGESGKISFPEWWDQTVFDGKGKVSVNPNFVNGGGSVSGLDLSVTKFDIFRACVEALTYESRTLLENCMRLKSVPCQRVRIGGGHAQSQKWVQFRADVTGKVYERMENNEVSALGTAVLAAYGVGLYPTLKDAVSGMVRVKDKFTPNQETHDQYNTLYQQYIAQ